MCGISGLYHTDSNRSASPHVLSRMLSVSRHRGPDDTGMYLDGNVGLGFNRLSIIDLSGGRQPMSNEDETAWIVFNGEIYNFRELRTSLQNAGHIFATHSDTETIIHAWEEFGPECVKHLRGMFAFAIWDSRQKILFAARDRLGIKPFFYSDGADTFAFASELKSLLEVPGVQRQINPEVLPEYLHHRYVIAPRTILSAINSLPPAHTISVTRAGVRVDRYWELPIHSHPRRISEAAALEEFDALMMETMRQHLIADVPIGAFLSGGLDSSAIVSLMKRSGVADIKTFSIGYDTPESELPYARTVALHCGTEHHELKLTPGDFQDYLPKIVWHLDQPIGDEACLPLYLLSEFARSQVKVTLSGEGSDEIFAGYQIYRTMNAVESLNRVPFAGPIGKIASLLFRNEKIRKYSSLLGRPLEARYGGVSRVFEQYEIGKLIPGYLPSVSPEIAGAYASSAGLTALARMTLIDLKTWLADDLLVKADRMSMANSLELRVPFLDHRVVEFAFGLPDRLKIHSGKAKYLLKRYMEPVLPSSIIHRPKRGFPVPTRSWFRQSLSAFARARLLDPQGPIRDYFDLSEVRRLIERHNIVDRSGHLYALLVFDQWHRLFLGSGRVEPSNISTALTGAITLGNS